MGLPNIIISFKDAAESAIRRSGRGVVCLLLDDGEGAGEFIRSAGEAMEEWSEKSRAYIRNAFSAGASAVYAARIGEDAAAALDAVSGIKWNWLATPEEGLADDIYSFISQNRAGGGTFKAVVANAADYDCEGIVNFCADGLRTASGSVSAQEYSVKIAGMLAGLAADRSATYLKLTDIVYADAVSGADAAVDAGRLIVVYDGDAYKLGRAVTSKKAGEFRKIKTVEGADMIKADLAAAFEENYIGKVANSYDNKQLLVSAINSYLAALGGSVLDAAYDNSAAVDYDGQLAYLIAQGYDVSDVRRNEVLAANTGSEVFLALNIKFLDAMEDITIVASLS